MILRIPKIIIKHFLLFLSRYIRMKVVAQRNIALRRHFKRLMSTLLPIVKRGVSSQINKIKSRIMRKIRSNKRQNAPKSVSNRGLKSLKNNFRDKATKGIINTPKIVIEKPY